MIKVKKICTPMYITLLFTLLSSIVFCDDESTTIWKKIDKNTLDIKLAETNDNIAVSIISEDYFPLLGSWNAGDTHIKLDQFFIDDLNLLKWVYMNIPSKEKLEYYSKKLGEFSFKFITNKELFVEKNNLECKLRLIKKEDFNKIMIEYFDNKSSLTFLDENCALWELSERFKNMIQHEVIYGIKFNTYSNEMPNLNEYELGIYVSEVKNETQMAKSSLKKKFKQTAIDVSKHTLICLGIFGPYAFFLIYGISKYLIK